MGFAKVLGTGDGRTFTVRDTDLRWWAVLCVWEGAHPPLDAWHRLAIQVWRADLALIRSRGRWARREPFGPPTATETDGPVAAITRAPAPPAARPALLAGGAACRPGAAATARAAVLGRYR